MKSTQRAATAGKYFNLGASQYNLYRRKLIPCFDDFYGALVAAAQTPLTAPKILDLGAGTGLVSQRLKKKYPKASFVLVDMAEAMLEIAMKNLRGTAAYVVGDLAQLPKLGPFDMVVSALSIHHLSSSQKQRLYRRIFSILNPGGVFVNADQVLGPTPALDKMYKQEWKRRIETSQLPGPYQRLVSRRMKLDREDPLETQLVWLRQIGFLEVASVYQWFPFAVMTGKKPGSPGS